MLPNQWALVFKKFRLETKKSTMILPIPELNYVPIQTISEYLPGNV